MIDTKFIVISQYNVAYNMVPQERNDWKPLT